jgi:uncharacterized membrane protein YqjE
MEDSTSGLRPLASAWRRLARRLLTIGENRFELLTVEMQEGRERLLQAFLMALGVAALGLLAAITLTGAIVVLLWPYSHAAILFILTGLYGGAAIWLCRKLTGLVHDWQTLPASLDQFRKDRACLEKILE